jgi:hypothetical protein
MATPAPPRAECVAGPCLIVKYKLCQAWQSDSCRFNSVLSISPWSPLAVHLQKVKTGEEFVQRFFFLNFLQKNHTYNFNPLKGVAGVMSSPSDRGFFHYLRTVFSSMSLSSHRYQ